MLCLEEPFVNSFLVEMQLAIVLIFRDFLISLLDLDYEDSCDTRTCDHKINTFVMFYAQRQKVSKYNATRTSLKQLLQRHYLVYPYSSISSTMMSRIF